jgi:pantothenate kinase-related protein Tda10
MFAAEGIQCIAMSLDDFYLPGEKQDQLAKDHQSNPLLQYRGNGNHFMRICLH